MKIILPKEELYKYYIIKKMSSTEIAKIFSVSSNTILRNLTLHQIQKRKFTNNRGLIKPINKELLFKLYVQERKSSVEISKILKLCPDTIIRQMRQHGITIRNFGGSDLKYKLNKKLLKQKYIIEKKSAKEISQEFNCSNTTILKWIRKFGFKDLIRSGYPKGRKNPKISGNLSPTKRPEVKIKMSRNHADFNGINNPNYGNGNKIIGDKNPNWQGGLEKGEYGWDFTPTLKKQIRIRDNYECQKCNMTNKQHQLKYNEQLPIHHIDYDKRNNIDDNLITLCLKCNILANYNRDYWYAYFSYIMENKQ